MHTLCHYALGQGAGKQRNTIGIVAFVTAVLGFTFAIVEGAYLLGWILLPTAFVLSLVALFANGKPKKLAVTALIISIVGPIAGALAFVNSAATAFDEAFDTETTVSEPAGTESEEPGEEAPEPAAEQPAPEGQSDTEKGTRANPLKLGSTVTNDDWAVTVNSFAADATSEVLEANQFNEVPADGSVYALVNVTVKRLSVESGHPMEVSVSYVTESGNVVTESDAMAVAPDDLSSANELYENAEATGNSVLMIPAGDAGVIRVSPGWFSDEVFFATT